MMARKKLNGALEQQQVKFEFTAGLDALSQLGLDEVVASKVERMLQRGDKRATVSAPPGFMFPELKVPFKIRCGDEEIELVFHAPGGAYAYIKPPGSNRTRAPAAWIEKAKAAGVLVPNPNDKRLTLRKRKK